MMATNKNVDLHLNWKSRIKKSTSIFHITRVWISRHM